MMKIVLRGDLETLIIKLEMAIADHIHKTGNIMTFRRIIKKTINGEIVSKEGGEEVQQQAQATEPQAPEKNGGGLSAVDRADQVQEELKKEKEARKKKQVGREERNINCSQLAYYWTRSSKKDQNWFLGYIQKHNKLGDIQCLIENDSRKKQRK